MSKINFRFIFKQPILILIYLSFCDFWFLLWKENVFAYIYLGFSISYSILYVILVKHKAIILDSLSKYCILSINFIFPFFVGYGESDANNYTVGNIIVVCGFLGLIAYDFKITKEKYTKNAFLKHTGVQPDSIVSINNDFKKLLKFNCARFYYEGLEYDDDGLVNPKMSYDEIKKYLDDIGQENFKFTQDDLNIIEMQNLK